ncbi:MAG: hypothetical protein NTZ59_01040 [Bacteroidetes bacterium]|jgi:hypothetical protein|nr:hypothetical protein [Bacteroidota bacterium]
MKENNTKQITVTVSNKPVEKTAVYSTNANAETNHSTTKNIFSNVDLWNVQKQVRTAYTRRRANSMLN